MMNKDVIESIMMRCRYTCFGSLAQVCRKFNTIAKQIRKKWMQARCPNLISIVEDKDQYKLLKVLHQIHNCTIKDHVSLINVYGAGNWLLFHDIVANLSPNCERFAVYILQHNNRTSLDPFVKDLVIITDAWFSDTNRKHVISEIHRQINQGMVYKNHYEKFYTGIYNPATAIVFSESMLAIETGDEENWSKQYPEPVNNDPTNRVEFLDYKRDKFPRYPLYIHMPYDIDSEIVDACLIECIKVVN